MRKVLLLLLPLFLSASVSKNNRNREIKVETPNYTVIYSEFLEQPKEVWYYVKCNEGAESRKGLRFYLNDTIYTSDDNDYYNNDWDKGHMAPAADFSCDRLALNSTFSYLNCALQHKDLNRKTWKYLEDHERDLKRDQKDTVKVHIYIIFNNKCKKLETGATIPYGFRKEISYGDQKEIYFFENKTPISTNYMDFRISE